MNAYRSITVALALVVITGAGYAQANASSAGSASVSTDNAVEAGRFDINATSHTSVNASEEGKQRPEHKGRPEKGKMSDQMSPASSENPTLSSGTTLNVVLTRPVDSKKCKPGDQVTAKITQDVKSDGRVIIPKGSKLVGHVAESQVRGEGVAQSSLSLVFDHASLKNGQQVQMNTVIQALARAQTSGAESDMPATHGSVVESAGGSTRGGGGLLGGTAAATNTVAGTAAHTSGNLGAAVQGTAGGSLNSATHAGSPLGTTLNSSSSGVVGLNGLSLSSSAASATQGSVITSSGKNVHLDSGTQMVLRVVQ